MGAHNHCFLSYKFFVKFKWVVEVFPILIPTKNMVAVHELSSNSSKMTVSNDHHKIDIDGKLYEVKWSTQENVKEDQHQPMIVNDKASRLMIFIQWARTKLHNFEIHGGSKFYLPLFVSYCYEFGW